MVLLLITAWSSEHPPVLLLLIHPSTVFLVPKHVYEPLDVCFDFVLFLFRRLSGNKF